MKNKISVITYTIPHFKMPNVKEPSNRNDRNFSIIDHLGDKYKFTGSFLILAKATKRVYTPTGTVLVDPWSGAPVERVKSPEKGKVPCRIDISSLFWVRYDKVQNQIMLMPKNIRRVKSWIKNYDWDIFIECEVDNAWTKQENIQKKEEQHQRFYSLLKKGKYNEK